VQRSKQTKFDYDITIEPSKLPDGPLRFKKLDSALKSIIDHDPVVGPDFVKIESTSSRRFKGLDSDKLGAEGTESNENALVLDKAIQSKKKMSEKFLKFMSMDASKQNEVLTSIKTQIDLLQKSD